MFSIFLNCEVSRKKELLSGWREGGGGGSVAFCILLNAFLFHLRLVLVMCINCKYLFKLLLLLLIVSVLALGW